MKNALVLHGTNNHSRKNWFQWLKVSLEEKGWKVWVPDLPQADRPSVDRYNRFIFGSDWKFDTDSVVIGHSSGAVAILGLLEALPDDIIIDTAVLVGSFKDNLGEDQLSDLFMKPFDFEKIKSKSKRFIFIHSDNDPYCPLEHAEYLCEKVSGEMILMPKEAHFSISTAGEKYTEFPKLLELILSE